MKVSNKRLSALVRAALALCVGVVPGITQPVQASSHREAPFITENPKVDGTDFYMFRSYEAGRSAYTTLIANYLPLQDAYGGPNYFSLDPDALYEIHVDNNQDAVEDLTFQFRFQLNSKETKLNINGKQVAVPLRNIGTIANGDDSNQTDSETYSLKVVRGNRRTGTVSNVTNDATGSSTFKKPMDYVGNKTFTSAAGYISYANQFIHQIAIPGCTEPGKVFVGQRKDPFVVNLGETFDLINVTNVLGAVDAEADDLADKNVTSLIMEVPVGCLTSNGDPTIAGWTTTSTRSIQQLQNNPTYDKPVQGAGAFMQQSRLANPLVNEVVIGLKDKNKFNGSEPKDDPQFIDYVTNPTFPKIVDILFGAAAMANLEPRSPRGDLVDVFLIGLAGANKSGTFSAPGEFLRLNTAVPATELAMQNPIGFLAGDLAGFPNGRRPYDDVTDVVIRAAMGALVPGFAPGAIPYTDCSRAPRSQYTADFPYLGMPIGGGKPGF